MLPKVLWLVPLMIQDHDDHDLTNSTGATRTIYHCLLTAETTMLAASPFYCARYLHNVPPCTYSALLIETSKFVQLHVIALNVVNETKSRLW